MRDATVLTRARVDEVIDGERRVTLLRTELSLPPLDGEPAVFIERSHIVGKPPGTPVILVHGFAQNRFTWRISGRSLVAELADAGFDVLNVELRGHGRSRDLGAGNARRFEEYVHDVSRVVRALERPPLAIGHSLGAGVLIGVATEVQLAGLVHLAGVFAFARHNATLRALARVSLAAEPWLTAAPVRMRTGWAGKLLAELYQISDIAGYGFPISGWTPNSIERDLLAERLTLGFDWTSVEVWLAMSRWAMGGVFPYTSAFQQLDVPLLVIAGDHDPLVTPEDATICFEASGSNEKQLVVFDLFHHGAHWGHVDLILGRRAPEIVWPVLREWLELRA